MIIKHLLVRKEVFLVEYMSQSFILEKKEQIYKAMLMILFWKQKR